MSRELASIKKAIGWGGSFSDSLKGGKLNNGLVFMTDFEILRDQM